MRLLAICLLLAAVSSSNPGVRIVADVATLNQALSKGISALEGALPISLGDFEFSKKLLWIDAGVSVTNATVQTVTFDAVETKLSLLSPNWIALNTLVSADVTLELALKFGFIRRKMSVAVSLVEAQVEALFAVNTTCDNKPLIQIGKFNLKLADLSIAISDPLIDMAMKALKDLIVKELPALSSKLVASAVPTINNLLETLPLRVPFAGFVLDLNLQGNPVVLADNYLSVPLNATLLVAGQSYPLVGPSETPVMNEDGLPVQLFLTDYTLQSIFTAFWPMLQLEVNAFPEAFQIITGFLMDTESFQILIPELYERYGEAPLLLSLSSVPGIVPEVQLTMGLQTTVTLNVTLSVQKAGEWETACSLQAAVALDVSFMSEQLNYYLQVNALSMTQLAQTAGTSINVANTQANFNEILTLYFADINGLFHNTMRLTFIGVPWLHVDGLEMIESAGYVQPGWQIRLT